MNKFILGTAQLGLKYGINNDSGKPSNEESNKIIERSIDNGIINFDTAIAYGNSNEILNKFVNINIFTKIPYLKNFTSENIKMYLKQPTFCLYLHDFKNYSIENINILKEEKIIRNVGVSVYDLDEAIIVLEDNLVDYLQIPFNILDTRWLDDKFQNLLKNTSIKIVVRSVYLQGLLINPEKHLKNLKIKNYNYILDNLKNITLELNISLKELCLFYVMSQTWVNDIIFGVETLNQLDENINLINNYKNIDEQTLLKIQNLFKNIDQKIIDPRQW